LPFAYLQIKAEGARVGHRSAGVACMSHELTIWHGHTELLSALNAAGVRYLVVGGVAVRFYVGHRPTEDIDIVLDKDPANIARAAAYLQLFARQDVHAGFATVKGGRLKIGEPHCVDVMTEHDTYDFAAAWADAVEARINGLPVRVVSKARLILHKRAWPQDRAKNDADLVLLGDGGD
jgi:hypothetical protein